MPDGITIPPWLAPKADEAENFLRGYQTGAQISEAQSRLAVQSQQVAEQSLRRQQELEIDKAYKQAMLQMNQSELAERKRVNDLNMLKSSRMFAAQEQYRRRVAAGEDPMKVGLEIGPMMGTTDAGLAGMARAQQATIPETLETTIDPKTGARFYWRGGRPFYIPDIRDTAGAEGTRAYRQRLRDDRARIDKAYSPDTLANWRISKVPERRAKAAEIDQQIAAIESEMRRVTPAPGVAPDAAAPTATHVWRNGRIVPIGQ